MLIKIDIRFSHAPLDSRVLALAVTRSLSEALFVLIFNAMCDTKIKEKQPENSTTGAFVWLSPPEPRQIKSFFCVVGWLETVLEVKQ